MGYRTMSSFMGSREGEEGSAPLPAPFSSDFQHVYIHFSQALLALEGKKHDLDHEEILRSAGEELSEVLSIQGSLQRELRKMSIPHVVSRVVTGMMAEKTE